MSNIDKIISDEKLNDVFFFLIDRMMKRVKEYTLSNFKENEFNVTKVQWVILKRIAEKNGSTQREIAETTFKDPAALTRILDILEKKQLVKRMASEGDRRSFEVHLTVSGSRLVNRMIPVVQDIRSKALQNVSVEELDMVKTVMKKMYNNFE